MDVISRVKRLIVEAAKRPCSVEQLCEELELSYHTIRKQFRRSEGMCLSEYYQTKRCEYAQKLLSDPTVFIFEVAYDMGFTDEANFTKWFKKRTGLTPTEYRQQFSSLPLSCDRA